MNNLTHDTINKSLLLNWLYMAKRDVELAELGNWIEAKTEGEYRLVKNSSVEKEASISRQLDKECLLEGAHRIDLDGKGNANHKNRSRLCGFRSKRNYCRTPI